MAGSQLVFEPVLLDEEWQNLENYPKNKNRCLRTYSREHAEKVYLCYRCDHDSAFDHHRDLSEIWTGDPYYAEVWLIRGKIEVRRFHEHCPFPPYPEEEEYECEEEEDDELYELPQAA
jgi:hypothetical protein